jgi:hypothetical protein
VVPFAEHGNLVALGTKGRSLSGEAGLVRDRILYHEQWSQSGPIQSSHLTLPHSAPSRSCSLKLFSTLPLFISSHSYSSVSSPSHAFLLHPHFLSSLHLLSYPLSLFHNKLIVFLSVSIATTPYFLCLPALYIIFVGAR